jgi:cytochrome P450
MATFLEQYDALDTAGRAALTGQYLAQRPKELFSELRENRPILNSPIGVLVSKAEDVRNVLSRGAELTVKLYANKMERITGPFILGMGDSARYRRELSLMRIAFPEPEVNNLTQTCRTLVESALQGATKAGRIDVVEQVTRATPTRFVSELYGVPGPDAAKLQRWARHIFHDIFLNLANDAAVRQNADVSGAEMILYLDQLIQDRVSTPTSADTVLDRLAAMRAIAATELPLEVIRHNLIGMIVGTIDTTSKAAAYAINWFLDNTAARDEAIDALQTGDSARFTRCVLEAMRFAPQATLLIRLCEVPTVLALGKPWQTAVAPGAIVFAGIESAMLDPDSVPEPDAFRTDRTDSMYLHFGYGQHSCFGRYINPIQISEIVRGVLSLSNVRRAPGDDGVLNHDGPFPSRLLVDFDSN